MAASQDFAVIELSERQQNLGHKKRAGPKAGPDSALRAI